MEGLTYVDNKLGQTNSIRSSALSTRKNDTIECGTTLCIVRHVYRNRDGCRRSECGIMYIVPMKDPSPLIRVCAYYNIIKLTIE